MTTDDLLARTDYLISLGRATLDTRRETQFHTRVDDGKFAGFRAAVLSFIANLYGTNHSYYNEIVNNVTATYYHHAEIAINILQAIKHEIENGWLISIKRLVASDVFSNFLEMSQHLLEEGYKDAAAVMIGSTLEEHLRQLCNAHNVETHYVSNGDNVPKKANLINTDLRKAGVYGAIEDKQVIAWLGIRNSAAHGNYKDYNIEQVKLMYQGVLDFISKIK